jgi:hypothetical protein
LIYHSKRSAIAHWDDNICHLELDKFVKTYLKDDLTLKDCIVHLIGGWSDHEESNKSGLFLKDYFSPLCKQLQLKQFQEKSANDKGTLSQQGFSLVALDTRDGKVTTSDKWNKFTVNLNDNLYRGTFNLKQRYVSQQSICVMQLQNDRFPNSGSHLYDRDGFEHLLNSQWNELCSAAKTNHIANLIKHIDNAVISVDATPAKAKGWTPLHFACHFQNYEATRLLIRHGANLYATNDKGTKAIDLIKDKLFKDKIETTYKYIQSNTGQNIELLRHFALFARHPEQLDEKSITELSTVQGMIETEAGLNEIKEALRQV